MDRVEALQADLLACRDQLADTQQHLTAVRNEREQAYRELGEACDRHRIEKIGLTIDRDDYRARYPALSAPPLAHPAPASGSVASVRRETDKWWERAIENQGLTIDQPASETMLIQPPAGHVLNDMGAVMKANVYANAEVAGELRRIATDLFGLDLHPMDGVRQIRALADQLAPPAKASSEPKVLTDHAAVTGALAGPAMGEAVRQMDDRELRERADKPMSESELRCRAREIFLAWFNDHSDEAWDNCADKIVKLAIAFARSATGGKVSDVNVAAVIDKHSTRAARGLAKYGVTTERGDLSTTEWLGHLQEELMDAAVYVQRLLAEFARLNPPAAGEAKAL